MAKTVDFYFDFGSPAAYLAYTQLPRLASETGATIVMKPILLGGVFQASGNRPPASVPLKGSYLFKDMSRFARRYGVRLIMNPFFPIITTTLMRMDLGLHLRHDPSLKHFRDTVVQAIWVDERNLNDPVTAGAVLTEAGFDPTTIVVVTNTKSLGAITSEQPGQVAAGDAVLATAEHMLLHVDVAAGKSSPAAPQVLAKLDSVAAHHSQLPKPANAGRFVGALEEESREIAQQNLLAGGRHAEEWALGPVQCGKFGLRPAPILETESGDRNRLARGEVDGVLIAGVSPALVTAELFWQKLGIVDHQVDSARQLPQFPATGLTAGPLAGQFVIRCVQESGAVGLDAV